MRQEYDFSHGKRGAIVSSQEKTRITIYLDNEILEHFREQAEAAGMGYQTLINQVLKAHIQGDSKASLTESDLREELLALGKQCDHRPHFNSVLRGDRVAGLMDAFREEDMPDHKSVE